MGQWTDDGGWTSNTGRHYGPNEPISDDADAQESSADAAKQLSPTAFSDPNSPQGNILTGGRLRNDAPGAQLDATESDKQRGGVGDLIAQLEQQAATGDGAWRDTFAAGLQRAKGTAQSVAQSTPNVGYGDALRNAGNAQAAVAQRGVGQENILRAQSEQDAQDQLGALLAAQGGQDIDQAQAAANARKGVRATNLTLKQAATKQFGDYASGIGQGVATGAKLSRGGDVPGQPKVFGDDEANDTVPAMLSPGEVVLPRSIAHDPQAAADFVRTLNASKARSGGVQHLAGGGDADPYTKELNRPWKPGDSDPTGPHPGSFDFFGAEGDVQAPSVDNGGLLDTRNFEQTRGAGNRFAERLRESAAGRGPSVAGQQMTNATDAAVAQAAQSGASAAAQALGAANIAESGGAEAALTRAKEQSGGQGALGRRLSTARGQELALANAQQQAEWQNTLTNLGIGVEQQAAMRNLFSGAGQAASQFAGMPRGGDDYGGAYQSDYEGDRGGPADLGASDPDFKAHGGAVGGYAGGGIVARGPNGEKLETDRGYIARRAAEQQKQIDDEEEEYSKVPPKQQPQESSFARALKTAGEYAKRAVGSIKGMAEGGDVDASGVPVSDASMLFYTPGPGVDAGTPALMPASFQPTSPPPSRGGMFSLPEGSGIERALRAPPGYDPTLGMLSAPAVVARAQADEAAKPLPKGIKAPDAASPKADETPPSAVAARPTGGGVAMPPSHALEEGFAANEAQLANQAQTDAEVQQARAEAEGLKIKEAAQTSSALEMKAAHDRARQQTSEAMTRWQTAQDEFNRIDTTVDPGRFWASRTTGQKVLGILGLALGAAGAGPDGVNKAAAMLNQAIDRDLDAQKAEYELRLRKGTQKLQGAQTYYSMAREAGHDDIAATELAKAAALDGAALKSEQLVASTREPIAKAKGQAIAAALRGGAIDKTKAGEQQTFENRVKDQTLAIQAEMAGRKASGLGEGERKELHDVTAAAADALDLIGSIRKGLDRTQSAIPGKTAINQNIGTDAARLGTDATALTIKLKDISKLGQIGPADKALLEELVANPQSVLTLEGTKRAKLDQLESIVRKSVQNQRAARGVQ